MKSINVIVEVEDVILAEGHFKILSMHHKICLFVPQLESKRAVKSRFNSSLGSDNCGNSLI